MVCNMAFTLFSAPNIIITTLLISKARKVKTTEIMRDLRAHKNWGWLLLMLFFSISNAKHKECSGCLFSKGGGGGGEGRGRLHQSTLIVFPVLEIGCGCMVSETTITSFEGFFSTLLSSAFGGQTRRCDAAAEDVYGKEREREIGR